MEVHEVDSAFLLGDVLLEVQEVLELLVPLEVVLEVVELEVVLLVVSVVEVEVLEVVEVDQAVVVFAVAVVLEVVQLLEDDVVRLEVEHPEVARCPPHPEVLAVVDHE